MAFQKAELSARERQKLEKEAAAQGAVDGRRGTDSNLLSRAAHVTRGDRLIISVLHSNCAPPPDLSVPIQEWTGQGRISVDYMYIPGRYSIKYVSSMCQGHVLGEAQVGEVCLQMHRRFAVPSVPGTLRYKRGAIDTAAMFNPAGGCGFCVDHVCLDGTYARDAFVHCCGEPRY